MLLRLPFTCVGEATGFIHFLSPPKISEKDLRYIMSTIFLKSFSIMILNIRKFGKKVILTVIYNSYYIWVLDSSNPDNTYQKNLLETGAFSTKFENDFWIELKNTMK
jgi:hypothetical protein